MNIISLFSGCGGLDLGFEKAGFNICVANEFYKPIHPTYKANHKNTFLLEGNVKNLTADDFLSHVKENIDGIIGGPPCQSWSVAGKREGLNDPRGELFFDYIRILRDIKPKFFLAENVKGMLNKKHSESVEKFIKGFENIGYDVSLNLVNATNFGVAQTRERVFYVGIRKDLNKKFVFPEGSTKQSNKPTLKDVIFDLRESAVRR